MSDLPRATYRVQLHAGFGFGDAADLVGYLADLGVSHLYCSPVLQSVAGSTHGYDVVDHSRLDEDRGGEEGWARLVAACDRAGLGLVVDIVPNHMAVGSSANRWWWDVLEDGPASRYARCFDIDWDPPEAKLRATVLVPVLGDHYGRVLEAGGLALARRGGSFTVRYADQELPLSPRSVDGLVAAAAARCGSDELASLATALGHLPPAEATGAAAVEERHRDKEVLRRRLDALCRSDPAVAAAVDAEVAAVQADPDALDALLDRQNHRLAHWRTASEELDYRRFFDIDSLVGVRVEDPAVFELTHARVLALVAAGQVDGLRVDHVDGLRDPLGYLARLREAVGATTVVVEKILAADEELPAWWPVAGTTGYDFLARVGGVFVAAEHEAAVTEAYRALTGEADPYGEVVHRAKLEVVAGELAAELERLTALAAEVCAGHRRHRDHTRRDLRQALAELAASMGTYRTYVQPGLPVGAADRARVAGAVEAARARRPDLDGELLAFLGEVLTLRHLEPAAAELALRFQQLSAPVTAKGGEDTAFYRYHRLTSLNEVGGDPGRFGTSVDDLHRANAATARCWPATMVTLSTHDTKRGADVRARISLLSEIPLAWAEAAARWRELGERHRSGDRPDRNVEHLLHQTLVGTWPIGLDRLQAYLAKAVREAKVHTSWTDPDPAYEGAVAALAAGLVGDGAFVADLEGFLAEHRVVERARVTSLAQVALLLTSPGVPDLYQGTELWDLGLVDPDNRRPVDHDLRRALLAELAGAGPEAALAHLDDGGAKLWLTHRLLGHRRRRPEPYRGPAYLPLALDGPRAAHGIAFARDGLAVVVPRLVVGLAEGWEGTTVALPPGRWRDVLTGAAVGGGPVPVAEVLARFPVAVLEREGGA